MATKWQHYLNYCKSKELTDFLRSQLALFSFYSLLIKLNVSGRSVILGEVSISYRISLISFFTE